MKKGYKKTKERIVKVPNIAKEKVSLLEAYKTTSEERSTTVYIGDVNKILRLLPEGIVDCIITSPPYWKQRDYNHPQQIGQEDSFDDYIKQLVEIFNEAKRVLKSTGTLFLNIGYKYHNKELLLIPELLAVELQKKGWTLINKIIWFKPNAMPSSLDSRFSNVYEPIFLFVKKESKYNYYLSLDRLRLPANNFANNKNPEDIIGFEVEDSLFKSSKIKGQVFKILKDPENNIFVEVIWENGKRTVEILQNFDKESQTPVELICPGCGKVIKYDSDINNHNKCKGFPIPVLPPKPDVNMSTELKTSTLFPYNDYRLIRTGKHNYKGKFQFSPDNRGASPGARKSLFGEYLVRQRRYKIFQPIIAEYLGFWRRRKGATIKEIDNLLGYKDTAGHWFRKDFGSWGRGGSIPLPGDWFKLKDILKFDDIYDRWVTETHLVLQTVKPHPKGKNPGDVWNIKLQPSSEAHFATFPEELVRRCIEAGCPDGGVVLDPFAGSGTVGKVACDLKRDAILIELVPEYLTIIKKRCPNVKEIIYVVE